jgi:hypothetical protein
MDCSNSPRAASPILNASSSKSRSCCSKWCRGSRIDGFFRDRCGTQRSGTNLGFLRLYLKGSTAGAGTLDVQQTDYTQETHQPIEARSSHDRAPPARGLPTYSRPGRLSRPRNSLPEHVKADTGDRLEALTVFNRLAIVL